MVYLSGVWCGVWECVFIVRCVHIECVVCIVCGM